jgi:heme/copper-type cytochrome/quinol oxidase subunit 2
MSDTLDLKDIKFVDEQHNENDYQNQMKQADTLKTTGSTDETAVDLWFILLMLMIVIILSIIGYRMILQAQKHNNKIGNEKNGNEKDDSDKDDDE